MATGKVLNTLRGNIIPLGLKAERQHHIVTNNPSMANPEEKLYIRIPRLTENTFFVPGSVTLSADVDISGNSKNSVVNNLGRNLLSKLLVRWGTGITLNVNNYHLFATYKDSWLTKEDRDNMVFQGIQHENLRKLRSGVAEANVLGETDAQKMLKTVYGEKYKIPIDFDLLSTHAPFYKFPIQEDFIFQITLAPKKYIIVTDTTANVDYKLKNICLEYDTVTKVKP